MHWGLRIATDSNAGIGHAVRCRSLARAQGGAVTLFADPDDAGAVRTGPWAGKIIQEASRESAELAREALQARYIDALLFDSYWVSEDEIGAASQSGYVAVIRDGGDYGAETVTIDPRPGALGTRRCLAGTTYMPLPERFSKLHAAAKQQGVDETQPLRVLVTFGQRDSNERTLCAVEGLHLAASHFWASVIIGQDYQGGDAVLAAVNGDKRFEILRNPDDLAGMFDQFDLSIGAPGVSQYERACCGLPTILVSQNERQEPLVAAWADCGAAIAVSAKSAQIAAAIDSLDQDRSSLAAVRNAGLNSVDGLGARRLARDLNQFVQEAVR